MNLSPHFTHEEMIFSQAALRNGWNNIPTIGALEYLKVLCNEVLEPLRAALNEPLIIDSGYRCPLVNQAVGGKQHSAHMDGRAADIRTAHHTPLEVCRMAYALTLPVAQIINEYDQWTHIAIPWRDAQPARQCLHSARTTTDIVYRKGFSTATPTTGA